MYVASCPVATRVIRKKKARMLAVQNVHPHKWQEFVLNETHITRKT